MLLVCIICRILILGMVEGLLPGRLYCAVPCWDNLMSHCAGAILENSLNLSKNIHVANLVVVVIGIMIVRMWC